MILNNPLNIKLLELLKEEYNKEAIEKGNSWQDMNLGDLIIKFQDEYEECQELLNNGKIGKELLEELIDLILVSSMLYRVSESYCKGSYKE